MKRLLVFFIATTCAVFPSNAQLEDNPSYDQHIARVYAGWGFTRDKTIQHVASQKMFYMGMNVEYAYTGMSNGAWQASFSSPFVYDLLQSVIAVVKTTNRRTVPHFTSFFNVRAGKNLLTTDNFALGAGLAFTDYFALTPYVDEKGESIHLDRYSEPSGWYLTTGPAIFVHAGSEDFLFSLTGSLDFSFYKGQTGRSNEDHIFREPGYESPMFISLNPRIVYKNFFIGYDFTRMIDGGAYAHETKRTATMFGVRGVIGD